MNMSQCRYVGPRPPGYEMREGVGTGLDGVGREKSAPVP